MQEWALPAERMATPLLHLGENVVHGDPSEDTSCVPWLESRLTKRSVSQCILKVELR